MSSSWGPRSIPAPHMESSCNPTLPAVAWHFVLSPDHAGNCAGIHQNPAGALLPVSHQARQFLSSFDSLSNQHVSALLQASPLHPMVPAEAPSRGTAQHDQSRRCAAACLRCVILAVSCRRLCATRWVS